MAYSKRKKSSLYNIGHLSTKEAYKTRKMKEVRAASNTPSPRASPHIAYTLLHPKKLTCTEMFSMHWNLFPYLVSMRRFAARSLRFMDGYRKGLNGKDAAWASKKYRGHRTLPEGILKELGKAGLAGEREGPVPA